LRLAQASEIGQLNGATQTARGFLGMLTTLPNKTILLIGASRGLGYAMAAEYLKHGWNVIGTVRGRARSLLHDLADASERRLEIETVDICEPDQIAALRARLSRRTFDVLFVNAGVTNNPRETIADVTTKEFVRVM
jgi:NAD(P)-dependent dehydrogenase (short-subunit alcohol dehydrogenase family)